MLPHQFKNKVRLQTVGPDWAIFESSWLQILLQKNPKYLITTYLGYYKNITY